MKILVTGATGFVGFYVVGDLLSAGHQVHVVSRNKYHAQDKFKKIVSISEDNFKSFDWDPLKEIAPQSCFEGVDGVINLMGHNVASGRWNDQRKKMIYDSRILGTRHLVEGIKRYGQQVKVLASASAIGIYGPQEGDQPFKEDSVLYNDFLARVCKDWEEEASKSGVRTVLVRIGAVLGATGGMLEKLLPIFRLGLAGPLGNGEQIMSWIHVKDVAKIFVEAMNHEFMKGPFNAVAPHPVSNKEFTKSLAKALQKPAFIPVPAFALKIAMGQMSEVALRSQDIRPANLQKIDFQFLFHHIDECCADIARALK